MQAEFYIDTELGKVYDITEQVEEIVRESGVKEGLANIFAPHATGVLLLGEFEPNIASDYVRFMKEIAPQGAGWAHDRIDDNAHAHLRSALFGTSLCVPIRNSHLLLGTWQRIMFVENDRSRKRRIIVTVIKAGDG